ncbi:MAG: MFS transporter [Alphaproteobacteria bacterium]|nr:MFS transporter [Alphaproteobacteria bacterium]
MSEAGEKGEWRRGWPVAVSAALGIGLGLSPLPFYTIGVFVGPMTQPVAAGGLGFSPAQVMLALPIYTFGALIMSPIVGILSDRIGVRRVAIASIVLFGLSMMALGLNNGSIVVYAITWCLMAVAGAGTLPITFTRAVNNWFVANRGIALGVALIATGMFGVLAKLLAQEVTALSNWRMGYVAVGALPLLIALPVALVAFRDVTDKPAREAATTRLKPLLIGVALAAALGLAYAALRFAAPQIAEHGLRLELATACIFAVLGVIPVLLLMFGRIGTSGAPAVAKSAQGTLPGLTLGQALKDWRFWLLAAVFIPISFAIGGPIPNVELLLGSKGFDATEAVGLASLVGLAVIAGRLVGGFLIDRFWAPGVACVFLAAPAIALWTLGAPDLSRSAAAAAIFLIGFGAGVEYDFMAYLVSRYFGARAYSSIYGSLYGFFAIGAGFGPPLFANAIRGGGDVAGFMHTAAIVLVVSSAFLLLLGRYRVFAPPQAAPAPAT